MSDTKSKLAQALRLIADALEAENKPLCAPQPKWIDEDQMFAEFGLRKNSADNRGIPRTRLGRKNHWKRSDIESSIKTEPVQLRPKVIKTKRIDEGDEIDALIASGSVTR